MEPAEFEEREFEAPLYNQLERGQANLWSPGQVLEARVGFDRSLFVGLNMLRDIFGHPSVLGGAVLSSYAWPPLWGPDDPERDLPNFALNLFIQAKRSWWNKRRPRRAKNLQGSGITWSFGIDQTQQRTLEILSQQTHGKAIVVYAAPAFHTKADLWMSTPVTDVPFSSVEMSHFR